jgi:hypothetical protein
MNHIKSYTKCAMRACAEGSKTHVNRVWHCHFVYHDGNISKDSTATFQSSDAITNNQVMDTLQTVIIHTS